MQHAHHYEMTEQQKTSSLFMRRNRKRKRKRKLPFCYKTVAAFMFFLLIIISIGCIKYQQNIQEVHTKILKNENMPPLQRLEFVHITKTGGSAIESIAAMHGIRWGVCHFADNDMVGCKPSPKPHVPWRDLYIGTAWHAPPKVINALVPAESNPYQNADLFVVVRNPYDRAISEYYCKFFVVTDQI